MKKQRITLTPILVLTLSMIFMLSCREPASTDIPGTYDTVNTLIEEGWQYYSDGNYSLARESFQSASELNAQETEAYIGKGWSYFRMESSIFATTEFNVVLNLAYESSDDASMADAYAGLFLIAIDERFEVETNPELSPTEDDMLALGNEIIEMGELILDYAPDYVTNHDVDFSAFEVHEMLAQTYFYLSRFQDAYQHVQAIYEDNFLEVGGIITTQNEVNLNPWINGAGQMQLFTFSDMDELVSITIPSGSTIEMENLLNQNSSLEVESGVFDYLLYHNTINVNPDFIFPSFSETITPQTISHAQPGAPSVDYLVLSTEKSGIFEIESAQKITYEDIDYWYHVDTTVVPWDTTFADGTYEDGEGCFFFSETVEEQVLVTVDSEIWTPVDPITNLPVEITDGATYNYNMIYLPNESNDEDAFVVNYKFASYTAVCKQTEDFLGYLDFLNQKISLSMND